MLDVQNTARFKNHARKNIKANTKNLKGEILSVDEEIALLQDHLLGNSMLIHQEKSGRYLDG